MGKERDKIMDKGEDRLSILKKVERGDISIKDAEVELAQILEESEIPAGQMETMEQAEAEELGEIDVLTRRERMLILNERFQNWNPQIMVGMADSWQWPWPDKSWQWMWQNFGYPVYVGHSIDVTQESELQVVLYQGDLFIRGWDEPALKINGAAFDLRAGQDKNTIRVAISTGQLQIWIPSNITRVEARVMSGDAWLRNICADIDTYCESGDLVCERIKGNIKARVNGGDVRIIGIEGAIDTDVTRGNSDVRNVSSANVSLKSTEGDIWLSLDSVNSGEFRCDNSGGDVNLLINGELACELLVEATEGGRILPVMLPWQRLLERSESKLHGILMGGGASISLIVRGGKVYIQESWMNVFPTPSPS